MLPSTVRERWLCCIQRGRSLSMTALLERFVLTLCFPSEALPPPSSANAPATGGTTRNLEPETRNPSNQTMDPPSCWADSKSVLACGPSPMLAEVARICREAGVECEVSLENQLGCGVGACYGCVVPVLGDDAPSGWARVCTDGPVFPAARIDWKRMETLLSAP